ncbi:hypothetical protein Tco_1198966, partial [Tanacetum coccineum]
ASHTLLPSSNHNHPSITASSHQILIVGCLPPSINKLTRDCQRGIPCVRRIRKKVSRRDNFYLRKVNWSRVLDLEKIKTTQHNEIASLKRRVKKLEKKDRSRIHRLKRLYKVGLTARVESSDNEKSLGEDASKQGRIDAIDADKEITLLSVYDLNVSVGEEVKIDTDHQLAERMQAQEQEELAFKRVNTFEDFRIELVEGKEKRARIELVQEITKKQKVEDDKETTELKQLMEIIPDE